MPLRLLALLACALISCTQRQDAAPLACGPIDGVEQVLGAPGVFIGDMHGTVESPAFLRDLSCHVLKSGKPLVVAMEYDSADQPVLDAFLLEPDEQQAIARLTGTPHWRLNNDGRASAAMRDALLAIRGFARAGGEVRFIAYDMRGVTDWRRRDQASAEHISRVRAQGAAAAYWIVFGGSVHARKTKGLPIAGQEELEPLGYHIRSWNLVHLDANYRGGTGWGCTGPDPVKDCSVQPLGPACTTDCPPHPAIRLERLAGWGDAYDGYYEVGRLTASPPLFRKWAARRGMELRVAMLPVLPRSRALQMRPAPRLQARHGEILPSLATAMQGRRDAYTQEGIRTQVEAQNQGQTFKIATRACRDRTRPGCRGCGIGTRS